LARNRFKRRPSPSPTYVEINSIINKLRNNNAPALDKIIAELIKGGQQQLRARLRKLILNIWNKETIPDEWLEDIAYQIYRKGDCKLCSSYRLITLVRLKPICLKLFNVPSKLIKLILHYNILKSKQNSMIPLQSSLK
jgi:hypothetical protein